MRPRHVTAPPTQSDESGSTPWRSQRWSVTLLHAVFDGIVFLISCVPACQIEMSAPSQPKPLESWSWSEWVPGVSWRQSCFERMSPRVGKWSSMRGEEVIIGGRATGVGRAASVVQAHTWRQARAVNVTGVLPIEASHRVAVVLGVARVARLAISRGGAHLAVDVPRDVVVREVGAPVEHKTGGASVHVDVDRKGKAFNGRWWEGRRGRWRGRWWRRGRRR